MISIAIRFTSGRYHSTPWGRNVNEATVAWPPEPWRILRALVAVWHRKGLPSQTEPILERLVEKLASCAPAFLLPLASHTHTRQYMPVREGAADRKLMVFDAFLQIGKDDPLVITWRDVSLDRDEEALLDRLLAGLGYLGRAESWVDAVRVPMSASGDRLSYEVDRDAAPEGELVDVLAPLDPAAYAKWRVAIMADEVRELGVRGKNLAALEATMPERFLDLLRLDTADWQAAGWNQIPGTRWATYVRPRGWDVSRGTGQRVRASAAEVTTARFAMIGRPLPRIEDAVKVGESMRAALMSRAGGPNKEPVPSVLSGRDEKGVLAGHSHAFFLAEDADDDGRIDHILVHADRGLADVDQALSVLRELRGGDDVWRLLLEAMGPLCDFAGTSALVGPAKSWISVTPYLHPWHKKKGFGPVEQITRELSSRAGSPKLISVQLQDEVTIGGRARRPIHFRRVRSRRGLVQPDAQGSFWRIEFEKELMGPLALGFGAHFGLGLFRPNL